jgi:hypothetical protein
MSSFLNRSFIPSALGNVSSHPPIGGLPSSGAQLLALLRRVLMTPSTELPDMPPLDTGELPSLRGKSRVAEFQRWQFFCTIAVMTDDLDLAQLPRG